MAIRQLEFGRAGGRVRWRGLGAAVLGAVAAGGLAPLGFWGLTLVALAALTWLVTGAETWRRAAWLGWCGGAGYFAAAMFWIVDPFYVYARTDGWMAPFALILMAGGMALFWALVIRFGAGSGALPHSIAVFMAYMGWAGVQINVILALLNLLPVPPLDGGRIAVALLPGRWSWQLSRIEPYGIIIVLALLVTPLWSILLGPPMTYFLQLFAQVAGFR